MFEISTTAVDVFTASTPSAEAPLNLASYLAIVLGLAVTCQWLGWALRIPSLLLLLVSGFALGHWVAPDEVMDREMLFSAVTIAVGVILFEGSLSLRFRELRGISGPVLRLCSSVVVIAWILLTVAARAVGIDFRLAVLLGAILVVTGPTVINPILRQMRPTRRVSSLLRWEGIVVDPIGAVLAVLVYQVIVAGGEGDTAGVIFGNLMLTLFVALSLSLIPAALIGYALRRHWVPDYLQGVVLLAIAVAMLVLSNAISAESGLLTVTILGIALANQRGLELKHVREFKEHLQILFVGVLFMVLAGRVSMTDIQDVAPQALAFVALAMIVVRPLSIWLGLWGSTATRQERLLLSCMAPRGIVAAAVVSIFALELQHSAEVVREAAKEASQSDVADLLARAEALGRLGEEAQSLVPLVFVLIVVTVTIYGLGIGRLAERLGLASTSPQGVLFAGASRWVVQAATQLNDLDVPVLVADKNYRDLGPARMRGLNTVVTNIVSEFAVEDLELGGLGNFIGATDVDSINSVAAREFAHIFGRVNSYQLRRGDDPEGKHNPRTGPAQHIVARYAFSPAVTADQINAKIDSGMVVRRTKISQEFTFADFRERHPDAVVMFARREGKLSVVMEESQLGSADMTLIALMAERPVEARTERHAAKETKKAKGSERRDQQAQAMESPSTPT